MMKTTLFIIAFLFAVTSLHGQSNWNMLARARHIAYLMEPEYRIKHLHHTSSRKSELTVELFPNDTLLSYLLDSVSEPSRNYINSVYLLAISYIFKGDSIASYDFFRLNILQAEFFSKYRMNIPRAVTTFGSLVDSLTDFDKFNLLSSIMPFKLIVDFTVPKTISVSMNASDWLKNKTGFEFSKYVYYFAAVVYDYVLDRSNDFATINIDVKNKGQTIYLHSFDCQRDIMRLYRLPTEPLRPEQKQLAP